MLPSDDDSNQKDLKENTHEQGNKGAKIKILSQSLLKAANLTSRKDFLNKVLESQSKINLVNKSQVTNRSKEIEDKISHTDILNIKNDDTEQKYYKNKSNVNITHSTNDTSKLKDVKRISESSDSSSDQTKFIDRINAANMKLKDIKSGEEEILQDSHKRNTKKEVISDSESSIEYERKIRKTQVSKLDISEINLKKGKQASNSELDEKVSIKEKARGKEKKLEVLSESSDTEYEKNNNSNTKIKLEKQAKQEESKSTMKIGNVKKKYDSSDNNSESETEETSNKQTNKNKNQGKKEHKVVKNIKNSVSESSSDGSDSSDNDSLKQSKTSSEDSESDSSSSRNITKSQNSKRSSSSNSGSDSDENDNVNESKASHENSKSDSSKLEKTIPKKHKSKRSSSSSSGSDIDSSDENRNIAKNRNMNLSKKSHSIHSDHNASAKGQTSSSKLKRKFIETKSSDEDSDDDISNKKRKYSDVRIKPPQLESEKLLETFFSENEYKKIIQKNEGTIDILGKSQEIYLLQVPKTIDPHVLIDKTVSFDGPTKLKIQNETYVWNVNCERQCDVNLIYFNNLLHIKPKGVVTLQQYFKSKNTSMEVKPLNDIADMPDNLKVRHPLFGIDYKENIKLDEDILKKLEKIVTNVRKSKKHKKKSNNKREEKTQSVQEDNLDIFKLLNEHASQTTTNINSEEKDSKKKKKKKKHKEDKLIHETDNEIQSMISDIFLEIKKSKKKKKHHSDASQADEQLNVSKILNDDSKLDEKSENNSYSINFDKEQSQFTIPTINYEKFKKKSKDKDICYSSDISKEESQLNMSEVNPTKPKKKKKKNHTGIVNSTMSTSSMGNTILHLDESCIPKTKKTKHNHRNSIDNFIDDLVKDVTSSDDTIKRKKKKKKHSY